MDANTPEIIDRHNLTAKALLIMFAIFLVSINFLPARAQENIVGKIESLDETITLKNDGTALVKDVVTYDFGQGNFNYAYRSFAVKYSDLDVKYKISNIAVTDASGKPVKFTAQNQTDSDYEEITIGDGKALSGKQTFTISYQVQGAFNVGENDSSFYWNPDSSFTNDPDKNLKVTVVPPQEENLWTINTNCSVPGDDMGNPKPCDSRQVQNGIITFTQAFVRADGYFNIGVELSRPAAAASADDSGTEQINSFDSQLNIQANNSVKVQEKIIYNFGDNAKHGIYRYIPIKFKTNLGTTKTRISNVSVTDENNQPYHFTTSTSGDNYNIKIGDPSFTISGVHTYILNYTISRVINFFSDHDELYWNVTGNGWEVPILKTSATVTIPGQIKQSDIKVQCFAGIKDNAVPCGQASAQYGQASFSQENLAPEAGLTIVTGFPKGLVSQPTTVQKLKELALDNWILIIPLIVLLGMFLLWYFKGRDPQVSNIVVAQYEAPADLTPGEAIELLQFSEPSRGITAEIIQLAVKGYIKINHSGGYEFEKLKPTDDSLKEFQKTLMDGLFGGNVDMTDVMSNGDGKVVAALKMVKEHFETKTQSKPKNSVMLSDLEEEFYVTLSAIKSQITKSLISQGLLAKNPITTKVIYSAIAGAVGFTGFFVFPIYGLSGLLSILLSALIIAVFGAAMPRRTLQGAQLAKQILGLKLYLNVAEKDRLEFHDAPEKTPERFEKLLPYAIALGVETQWAKQFEGIYTTPPSWYNDRYSTFNALALTNSLHHFHNTSSRTLASSPHSSSASSGGSGFGGGSSGGGFGGGGGGSW